MERERIQLGLSLAEAILDELELGEAPLRRTALKCVRFARVIGNEKLLKMFRYELAGYPEDEDGQPWNKEIADIATEAKRFYWNDFTDEHELESRSIGDLEFACQYGEGEAALIEKKELDLERARARATVFRAESLGKELQKISNEKNNQKSRIRSARATLDRVVINLHQQITDEFIKLKFEGFVSDILEKRRKLVDAKLAEGMPEISQKFVSASDGLKSNNPEDWAGAASTCRRILKDLADKLQPATGEVVEVDGKKIELTDDKYINRLIRFIESKSSSKRFKEIVGSHLRYIGDRIDAINNSGSKGAHTEMSQEEGERVVVYTYNLVHDILSLDR